MSETTSYPCYRAYQAHMGFERAEAIVNAFCELYDRIAALFTRRVPAATTR